MAVWGRFVNNHIVEMSNDDPTGIYPPNVIWKELPGYALKLNYSNFGLDDKGNVILANMNEFREIIKNIIAAKRWQFQDNYYVVYKDNRYSTDRESCNTLTSAISLGSLVESSQKDVTFKTPWKTLTGFTVLELKDLITIAILLGQFVNDIFAVENDYDTQIDNEDNPEAIYELSETVDFAKSYETLKK